MRLAELIGTMSLAVDASIGLPESHALRSATLAVRLAELVHADQQTRQDCYYLALLALCGCTAESATSADVLGDEVAFGEATLGVDYGRPQEIMSAIWRAVGQGRGPVARVFAMGRALSKVPQMAAVNRAHCEVGVHLAERFGFAEPFRAALFQAFERWDGSGSPRRLRGDDIALSMRIAQVAMDVDIGHCLGGLDAAVAHTKKHARRGLDPEIVERFHEKASDVCAVLDEPSPWAAAMASEPAPLRRVEDAAIDDALLVIADFADVKSRFTLGHSPGVARRARTAAERLGLDRATTQNVYRAGLSHDVGRVGVSGGIWDKREPLNDAERERIRLHTYIGERLLSRASALEPIAAIAMMAHERLAGKRRW
jgi:HD-GYP domain-containing protein (c-di-GMP phosphodiesterase class II)